MVLVVEVGGRWSGETRGFLSQLARARARAEIPLMRRRAEQGRRLRWAAIFACAAAKAVASSLLNMLDSHGGDGKTLLSHEVDSDHRFAVQACVRSLLVLDTLTELTVLFLCVVLSRVAPPSHKKKVKKSKSMLVWPDVAHCRRLVSSTAGKECRV